MERGSKIWTISPEKRRPLPPPGSWLSSWVADPVPLAFGNEREKRNRRAPRGWRWPRAAVPALPAPFQIPNPLFPAPMEARWEPPARSRLSPSNLLLSAPPGLWQPLPSGTEIRLPKSDRITPGRQGDAISPLPSPRLPLLLASLLAGSASSFSSSLGADRDPAGFGGSLSAPRSAGAFPSPSEAPLQPCQAAGADSPGEERRGHQLEA